MNKNTNRQSVVASIAVKPGNQKELVFDAVEKAMQLTNWKKYVKGDNIIIKMNAVWDKVYPCTTTSPMIVEAVIRLIKNQVKPRKITIADTDTAAMMHTDDSFRVLGIDRLAKQYKVNLVSLTRSNFKLINFDGKIIKHFRVSETLLEADNIITLPILKTHGLSQMTFAIKNQWGLIHDMRHNFHLHLADALGDVNSYFHNKIQFAVGDCLICMEGTGPKTGTPVEVGHILASHDLVALDAVGATIMGLDPAKVPTIKSCEAAGVGTKNFKLVGDKPPVLDFQKPDPHQMVFFTEMTLRHLGPQVEWFLFKTPFLHVFRLAAKIYNDVWFYLFAKPKADVTMRTRWGQMWKSYVK